MQGPTFTKLYDLENTKKTVIMKNKQLTRDNLKLEKIAEKNKSVLADEQKQINLIEEIDAKYAY
jgi:hypothetical protein